MYVQYTYNFADQSNTKWKITNLNWFDFIFSAHVFKTLADISGNLHRLKWQKNDEFKNFQNIHGQKRGFAVKKSVRKKQGEKFFKKIADSTQGMWVT